MTTDMMRMGSGAGFSSDRLGPAVDLAKQAELDWLVFETIGERTLAFGHRDRLANPSRGYNPQLAARMRGVLQPCRDQGTRIMTNMGVANVEAAAEVVISVARELGMKGLKVAAVLGDEVTDQLNDDTILFDYGGRTLGEVDRPLVGANAYLGIDAILPAVETGADVVITGRVADPSLFLAPIVNQFGWARDDWAKLGQGTLVGHLMECGMQITGGYFADPGRKHVPRPAECGYPIAAINADGRAEITKLETAGGMVNMATVKEQLMYEVHDPTRYLTPDVTADFSTARLNESGQDRVGVASAGGTERPKQLKVTVGFDGGLLGEAGVSYAGVNAAARARLAADILRQRFDDVPGMAGQYRVDLIGLNSVHGTAKPGAEGESQDVRVRAAMRSMDRDMIETMLWEVEAMLCCGPAGGGGYRGQITPGVVTHSTMIDRDAISPSVKVYEA
ncbi:MAG: DUF1446 domain-containing protein [Alphaproteobacteria bacterium]|nr:DUF1446 domain-containing protein [Alphaproteobacteria bacterium]